MTGLMFRILALASLLILAPIAVAGPIPFLESPDQPVPHGPGTILVDHQPYNSGGLASDTLFSEIPDGQPFPWQLVADDFSIPATGYVRQIRFWGYYNYGIEPTTPETFEVQFFHARPGDGLPGDVIYQGSFVNVPRQWTGRQVLSAGGGREYLFTIDLPDAPLISGGETDWLSIHQIADLSTAFRWEFSATDPLNGQGLQNPNYPNWVNSFPLGLTVNTAFQLDSVPEPSTGVMLGLWTWCASNRRVSRRTAHLFTGVC